MALRAKCYVLNAVFAFAFTPCPLKLITWNKQWLNSVLLSSLLKFWDLVLNNKCPNKSVFYGFYGFIVIFMNFLRWNLPKFLHHIASSGIRILNTKKVGVVKAVFSIFQIYVFYRCKKSALIDFSEKRAPTKVKYFLPICQILRNFTEGNRRKFTVSFAFLLVLTW